MCVMMIIMNICLRCDPHHKTPDLSRVEDRSERRRQAEAGDCHHQSRHQRRLTLPSSRLSHHHDNKGHYDVPDKFVTENPGYEPSESLEMPGSQEEDVIIDREEDVSGHVAKSRRSRSLHLVHNQGRVVSESSSERPDVSPGLGRMTGTEMMMEKTCAVHQEENEEEPDISRDDDSTEGFTNLRGVSSRSVGSIAQAVTAERSTSVTVAEVAEDGTQTRITITQNIETQTSVDIPQQQPLPPTTVAVIETYHANGAIPKHSRKKSLPEASYLPRMDTTPEPYEILASPPVPKMRPRPNTYSEVNSRPHSSISMVYTDTWPGAGLDTQASASRDSRTEAAARTERQFHTLERESARVGRHPHPGALDTMELVTRGDSRATGHTEIEADQVINFTF